MKINLNDGWTIRSAKINDITANVPCSVLSALLQHGLIPNPYYRDNEIVTREYLRDDCTFFRSFELPQECLDKTNYLFIDGIDTVAKIFINGVCIANVKDMHLRKRIKLDNGILRQSNVIRVEITSPYTYTANYPNEGTRAEISMHRGRNTACMRKALYMFGWDWGPDLADMGIWRDIYLVSTDVGYLQNFRHECEFGTDGSVTVQVNTQFDKLSDGNITAKLSCDVDGTEISLTESLQSENKFTFVLDKPQLWYPNGFGEHTLYNLQFAVDGKEQQTYDYQIGIRNIVIDDNKDEIGRNFAVYVNGVKVFLKGGDYVPQDNIVCLVDSERNKRLIKLCTEFNHNVIRIWGGGYFPSDDFYNECDKNGLLVFQDLMFACGVFNPDDDEFVSLVKEEIADNLQRIRHHACMLLISGDNECEEAGEHVWFKSPTAKDDYRRWSQEVIQPCVKANTNLYFLRSSPTSTEIFTNVNNDSEMDTHYWGVWHGLEPFEAYQNILPRLLSEFGCQSFPLYDTVTSYANNDELDLFSPVMQHHQKNETCNDKILFYEKSVYGEPKDFRSLVWLSILAQAEGIKICAEHLRRNKYRCNGVIYWQLNDSWPGQSWSSLDYYYGLKALHYYSRKFYAPGLVSVSYDGNTLGVNVSNDTAQDKNYKVLYKYLTFDGKLFDEQSVSLTVDKASDKYALRLPDPFADGKKDTFVYVELRDGDKVVSSNFFQKYKGDQVVYPHANVTVQQLDDYSVKVSTDNFAKNIYLDFHDNGVVLSDNYFNLLPDSSVVITSQSKLDMSRLDVWTLNDLLNK